ncbi:hypothetical protein HYALB_00003074 [Hymenoscyphus albidus]|uniref:CFEM domain-containing protein n=1 Tax=Hymenoscyphus albidus TaxID=595503 RepID=A0A9N9LZY1_9HELO|nr:hypothetical protein HYALB_00003074 [Hymenoscyphus albidus]
MKNAIGLIILRIVGSAVAQDVCESKVSKFPECASSCILSAGSAVGCQRSDLGCQCSSSANSAMVNSAIGCVLEACGTQTAIQVSLTALDVCSCVSAHPTGAATAPTVGATTTEPVRPTQTPLPSSARQTANPAAQTGRSGINTTGPPVPGLSGSVDDVQVWIKTEVLVAIFVGAANVWL